MKGFILALQRGRLVSWVLAALVLLAAIALLSPQQLPVVLYKLALVSVAAIIPGASRLESQVMPPLDENGEPKRASFYPDRTPLALPLPKPKTVSANKLLPLEQPDSYYIEQFLEEFGATVDSPIIFEDVMGESLVISSSLFISRSGHSKVKKRGRERYLRLLAEAIQQPDEIWVRAEYHHLQNLLIRAKSV